MTALAGYRVGITSARKAEELATLLVRRGATVESAPALCADVAVAPDVLRAATEQVLAGPVDVLVATTGTGVRAWFDAAASWGHAEGLRAVLAAARVLARGQKTVGALRRVGLHEQWSAPSERLQDVLAHLRLLDLRGKRVVLQEHGQSLAAVAGALRVRGAEVVVVPVYRCETAGDLEPMFRLVDLVAGGEVDAVTFTSAPAVATLMHVATASGQRDAVVDAFRREVLAACVGPVTAEAFDPWNVPTMQPERSRLAAMVQRLELELPLHRAGTTIEVAGHVLLLRGEMVWVDGRAKRLSPAPYAVLRALAARPGRVVSRATLLTHLPRGQAASEHAVDMAVSRLRNVLGAALVETVVKRGYRLPVDAS